jgi:splicing factor 45
MAAPPPPPPPNPRGGMSLYADLLDGDSSASISRAPVTFKQPGDSSDGKDVSAKKATDSALRFQPIRRPQAPVKVKPKGLASSLPKTIPLSAPAVASQPPTTSTTHQTQQRSTLADWAATEDDEYMYGTGEKRQRGGRRRNKKKANAAAGPRETDWDALYDPARPTNVEEYLRSDERIREVREWKAVLYAHRRRRESSSEAASDDDDGPPQGSRFAPPGTFAPPGSYGAVPPPPPAERQRTPDDDATGDDAYARRMAMGAGVPPPPARSPGSPPPPPPPPAEVDGPSISRAPVRYQPPAEDMEVDSDQPASPAPPTAEAGSEDAAPRTNRPGQAGFASRFMAKYGWSSGSGLGAESDGITSALRVKVEKRKRRPDAEGGGFATPAGRGKIIGGARTGDDGGKRGKMSEVVVLRNMLEGMPDLAAEVEAGLGQEIGEECGEKYGRVERVFIDVAGRRVFIKFTDGVSALRAVSALEGRVFNGNAIEPAFWDLEKFDQGIYE